MLYRGIKSITGIKSLPCVYFIVFPDGFKIGQTNNFSNRINTYLSMWCRDIDEIYQFQYGTPKYQEQIIMKYLKDNLKLKSKGEFFYTTDFKLIAKQLTSKFKIHFNNNLIKVPDFKTKKTKYKNGRVKNLSHIMIRELYPNIKISKKPPTLGEIPEEPDWD